VPEESAAQGNLQAIQEENRKLEDLRSLVDRTLMEIRAGRHSLAEAQSVVEQVRSRALKLFPGKETAFDLIYRPRFRRALNETFKLHN
jgi:hypothetical protein